MNNGTMSSGTSPGFCNVNASAAGFVPGAAPMSGVPVWLKLECLQKTGSFKPRGAFNKLLALTPEERRRIQHVIRGNHLADREALKELGYV